MDTQTAIANMRAELLNEATEMGIDLSYLADFLTDEFVLNVCNEVAQPISEQQYNNWVR